MTATEYPILVETFSTGVSMDVGCNDCGQWWRERDVDDYCERIDAGCCPKCGASDIAPRYEEADKCKSCDTLGLFDKALNYCCSRACMLQAEYAESLRSERCSSTSA